MSIAALTPNVPDPGPASVETLLAELNRLTGERQQLRSDGCGADGLEQNRREIVRLQWQLARALIDRYSAPTAA